MIGYFKVYNEETRRCEWTKLKIIDRRKVEGFDVCFARMKDYKNRYPIYAFEDSTGVCINHLCSILGNATIDKSERYARKLLRMYGGRNGSGYALELFKERTKDVFGIRKKQVMDYLTLKKIGVL